jgi:hypothetical protein
MRYAKLGASGPILPANLPLACLNLPGSQQKIPGSISQGISAKTPENVRSFEACKQSIKPSIHKFPVIFPDKREFGRGDGFESDCVRHHAVPRFGEISRRLVNSPELAGLRASAPSL